jgi:ADP-ribosyl-[dinitrogen reductase] hydrolase
MRVLTPINCNQVAFPFQEKDFPYPPESSQLWIRPSRNLNRSNLEKYALTFDGYAFARALGFDLIPWGADALQEYLQGRKSLASFLDLRCLQFWVQRRLRFTDGHYGEEDFELLLVNQGVCDAWDVECGTGDLSERYRDELHVAVASAQVAAGLSRDKFHAGKASEIDLDADKTIQNLLLRFFPHYGYLSEELGHVADPRDPDQHMWLVDPQDGTAAASKGFRGGTISIALLRAGVPVLGVVVAYAAPDSAGDLFFWAEGMNLVHVNDKAIRRTWPQTITAEHVALVSQDGDNASQRNAEILAPMRFITVPSIAYRFALVAGGYADLAVSLAAPVAHDLAGGHALLLACGGDVFDARGNRIKYTASGRMIGTTFGGCFGGTETTVRPYLVADWPSVYRQQKTPELSRLQPGDVVEDPMLLSRAQGCLLGQIAGDSLGSLVEFSSAKQVALRFPGAGPKALMDGGHWNTLAGQPTDDSELALAMARSIIARGGYDREYVAQAYCDWFASGPFDKGNTISAALTAAIMARKNGESPVKAAAAAAKMSSQANGALMRVSPLGIYAHNKSVSESWELAKLDCELTHPNPICVQANALFACAIAFAIRRRASTGDVFNFCLQLANDRNTATEVKDCLSRAQSGDALKCDDQATSGWVLIAFQNAFHQLLHADSLEVALVRTVLCGGDTDTNASIAGALLGAVYGRDALPAQWTKSILSCRPISNLAGVGQPRPSRCWPVDALVLAERLLLAGK